MTSRTPLLIIGLLATGAAHAADIQLKWDTFDPGRRNPAVPLELSVLSSRHWVVQAPAGTPASAIERDGVVIDGYVPTDAWIVRADGAAIEALRSRLGPVWVSPMHPAFKFDRSFGQRGLSRAVVRVFASEPASVALEAAYAAGLAVVSVDTIGDATVFEAVGPRAGFVSLAFSDAVQFIEDAPVVTLRNDKSTWVTQSNVTNSRPVSSAGLRGEGLVIGLIDGRMSMGHDCFRDPANNTPGPSHRKVVLYSSAGGLGNDSHGTHTAGTIAGDREPISGLTLNNGHAPKGRIAFTNLDDVSGTNLYTKLLAAYNVGALDHSNSWGDDGTTAYTSWCAAIDQLSWDREDAMVAFAVTNTSTLKTPENAKSCLAVGASQQTPNQGNHGSGGTGPTADGRRKPEIYAPGIGIVSAQSSTTAGFVAFSGTSMACPAVTGSAGLVRQYYREGRMPGGSPNASRAFEPSGNLVRATVIAGAVDMAGVAGSPSNREGFGRLLLDNALELPGDARRLRSIDVRRAQGLLDQGSITYTFAVQAGQPLRFVLSFNDFPGTVNSANPVVNNLDLSVVGPGGSVTLLGNVFNTSTGESVPGGTADAKNSTEMVSLAAPAAGNYRVTVSAARVAQSGGRQGFALVATGAVQLRTPLAVDGVRVP